MGFVGSLMVPLLIGVEASVGATDKTAEHCVVGLSLMIVFFFMVFAGRIRYLKLEGKPVGRKTDIVSLIFHKYGGLTIVALAWWNCYTGLVRIGPEDSYIQIVVLSSFPMGYGEYHEPPLIRWSLCPLPFSLTSYFACKIEKT
jgi:hypothetical protein